MKEPTIKTISRLRLRKNDILIVGLPGEPPPAHFTIAHDIVQKALDRVGLKNKVQVIAVPEGVHFKVLREEKL